MEKRQYTEKEKKLFPYAVKYNKELNYKGAYAYFTVDGRHYDASSGRLLYRLSYFGSDNPEIHESSYQDYWDDLYKRADEKYEAYRNGSYVNGSKHNGNQSSGGDTLTVYRNTGNGNYISYKQSRKDYWITEILTIFGKILIEIILLPITMLTWTDANGHWKGTNNRTTSNKYNNNNNKDWY